MIVIKNYVTKLEKPLWMTTEEAEKRYYPNSYVMINCVMDEGDVASGEVVAYAPMMNNGGQLCDLADDLCDAGMYGDVWLLRTKDPLDGGSLLIEYTEAVEECVPN